MAPGDVVAVERCTDVHYVDTGMFDTAEYGAVYLIDAEHPALVDTGLGTNYERILDLLDAVGIQPEELAEILLTHVHLDHAGGAGFLAEACPNAEIRAHEIGASHVIDPERLVEGTKRAVGDQWQFYAPPKPVPEERVTTFADGDTIDLGDRELDIHHAPGHAPHQVVFHDTSDDAVYTGDAAGIWVPSREEIHVTSPPPNFELEQAVNDVNMIRDLDPDVLCYPHFGPGPADVQGVLDDYEDALVAWVEDIETKYAEIQSDASIDADAEAAVVEHFVAQNEMGEIWGELKADAETAMNVRGVLHYLQTRGK